MGSLQTEGPEERLLLSQPGKCLVLRGGCVRKNVPPGELVRHSSRVAGLPQGVVDVGHGLAVGEA